MTDGPPAAAPEAEPRRRRLVLLVGVAIAVVAVAIAASTILGGPGRRVETGIVVSVEATSLSAVRGFSILMADGRTLDFRIERLENAATFPPGHLAEHKVSLDPVVVTFVERDGGHVAVRIEDGP